MSTYKSEVRDSIIRELSEKVRKQNYKQYLYSVRLERIRLFQGAQITFEFPVTALVGPNGGGKSTILGACACAYNPKSPYDVFRKSRIGDQSMDDWKIEYEVVDKVLNPKGTIRSELALINNKWSYTSLLPTRKVKMFPVNRTVPPSENPLFMLRKRLSIHGRGGSATDSISTTIISNIEQIKEEAQRILGKSLGDFKLVEITLTSIQKPHIQKRKTISKQILDDGTEVITRKLIDPPIVMPTSYKSRQLKQIMYIGKNDIAEYSEFNFGSGETSVIRMVADIENLPENSLVLIDEIENGLHPLAVQRMVEYLISTTKRRNIQVIFTTHSDYALTPLPSEAIWASIDGKLQKGKLSVEILRVLSGRIDKKLAIFVEDDFAKKWVEAILREKLNDVFDETSVYPVYGDGNVVTTHLGHMSNPSVSFDSICFIDGDSKQKDDNDKKIFRLPGTNPELTVFNSILENLEQNIALLTVACHRPINKQGEVAEIIEEISRTNRDPHLIFSQIGVKMNFIAESVVVGAFLSLWVQINSNYADEITKLIKDALDTSL